MSILIHFLFLGGFSFLFFSKFFLIQCIELNKIDNPNSLMITMAITCLLRGKDDNSSLSESPDFLK